MTNWFFAKAHTTHSPSIIVIWISTQTPSHLCVYFINSVIIILKNTFAFAHPKIHLCLLRGNKHFSVIWLSLDRFYFFFALRQSLYIPCINFAYAPSPQFFIWMRIQMLQNAVFCVLALTSKLTHKVDTVQRQVGRSKLWFEFFVFTWFLVSEKVIFVARNCATVTSAFQIVS